MKLKQLSLRDFRNIQSASLKLEGLSHFFLGKNGQGKSNLLEAAGMLTALRSFRVREANKLIRNGTEQAGLYFLVDHEKESEAEITLYVNSKGKRLQVDGSSITRLADYVGRYPVVSLCADDIQILRGGPFLRRQFLDSALASVNQQYYHALLRFQKSLQARNKLLKSPQCDRAALDALDKTMAPPAWEVRRIREEEVKHLAEKLEQAYTTISDSGEKAEIRYQARHDYNSAESYLELLESRWERDIRQGSTSPGPHRDDLGFYLDSHPAQSYASEGQQRGLVTSLRLAQIHRANQRTGCAPIIIADDVLGELDSSRKKGFWQAVEPQWQIIASGTEPPPEVEGREWTIWNVDSGDFSQRVE